MTVTGSEIRMGVNGRSPHLDTPAVRAPARASIPVTVRDGKIRRRVGAVLVCAQNWWGWTGRPESLHNTWRATVVDPQRVPLRHPALVAAWKLSNATDRLLMFAAILLAPTVFTGPLRWLAARPTRRCGFYLVAVSAATYILIGHYAGKG